MNMKELHDEINGLSLLYVEDEDSIRKQTAVFFKKFFKSVDVAQNGEIGLKFFTNRVHDVVITDLKMPKMDGEAMLKGVVQIKHDVITVVMSGISGTNGIEHIKSDFFIRKPATIDDLIEVMTNIVQMIKK